MTTIARTFVLGGHTVGDLYAHACDGCGRNRQLLARTVRGLLCHTCARKTNAAGAVSPDRAKPVHEIEQDIRESMLKQGGGERHKVRKGLT